MTDGPTPLRFLSARDGSSIRFVREDVARAMRPGLGEVEVPDPWAREWRIDGRIEGGRRSVEVVTLAGTTLRVVAKTLRRGGVLGRFLGGTAARSRVDREIAIARRLLERNVPAVELLALRATDVAPGLPLVRLDYLTAAIEDACDGERFVRSAPDRARRQAVLERCGATVRSMHDAGIDHVDLNVRNLIVDGGGNVRVLDFGASRIHASLPRAQAIANLARLWRSCVKRGLDRPDNLTRSDVLRFLRGYAPDQVQETWRDVQRRFAREAGFHRLAWRLFGRS